MAITRDWRLEFNGPYINSNNIGVTYHQKPGEREAFLSGDGINVVAGSGGTTMRLTECYLHDDEFYFRSKLHVCLVVFEYSSRCPNGSDAVGQIALQAQEWIWRLYCDGDLVSTMYNDGSIDGEAALHLTGKKTKLASKAKPKSANRVTPKTAARAKPKASKRAEPKSASRVNSKAKSQRPK